MDLKYFYQKYGKDNVNLALRCKTQKDVEDFTKKAKIEIDEDDLSKLLEHVKMSNQKKALDLDELEAISGGKESEKKITYKQDIEISTDSNNVRSFTFGE